MYSSVMDEFAPTGRDCPFSPPLPSPPPPHRLLPHPPPPPNMNLLQLVLPPTNPAPLNLTGNECWRVRGGGACVGLVLADFNPSLNPIQKSLAQISCLSRLFLVSCVHVTPHPPTGWGGGGWLGEVGAGGLCGAKYRVISTDPPPLMTVVRLTYI